MKINWFSNAPWAGTGYGTQTAFNVPRLVKLGHDVTIIANFGLQGGILNTADGVKIMPAGRESQSRDTIIADFEALNADILITLYDIWIFDPEMMGRVRWCPWLPIDHDPIPPHVATAAAGAFKPIAYSKFGLEQLQSVGFDDAAYVPHAIDMKTYKPGSRKESRQSLGAPEDKFMVGMVLANKDTTDRKAFDQQIRAFGHFADGRDDVMLYLHTNMTGSGAVEINRILEMAGLEPTQVAEVPTYAYGRWQLGFDYMVKMYNSLDLLMNVTKGEGFGLPIIEAQACGVPVLVGNWTSMPELVAGGGGWTIDYSDKRFYQGSYQFVPSVDDIVDHLNDAYDQWVSGTLRDVGQKGRKFVHSNYNVDTVAKTHWKPVLEQIAEELEQRDAAILDFDNLEMPA